MAAGWQITDGAQTPTAVAEGYFDNGGFVVNYPGKGLSAIPWYVWALGGVALLLYLRNRKKG